MTNKGAFFAGAVACSVTHLPQSIHSDLIVLRGSMNCHSLQEILDYEAKKHRHEIQQSYKAPRAGQKLFLYRRIFSQACAVQPDSAGGLLRPRIVQGGSPLQTRFDVSMLSRPLKIRIESRLQELTKFDQRKQLTCLEAECSEQQRHVSQSRVQALYSEAVRKAYR